MRADIEAEAMDEVRRRAHSLKSTARSFGVVALADLAQDLETGRRRGGRLRMPFPVPGIAGGRGGHAGGPGAGRAMGGAPGPGTPQGTDARPLPATRACPPGRIGCRMSAMRIHDPVYGSRPVESIPLLMELLDCPSMRRLAGIDQGGMSRAWFPGAEHSRLEHSAGVMLLLSRYGASLAERAAGLIHDVSHSAFSHCMDYVLDEGSPVEQSLQDDVHSRRVMASEIPGILARHGLDVDEVLDEDRLAPAGARPAGPVRRPRGLRPAHGRARRAAGPGRGGACPGGAGGRAPDASGTPALGVPGRGTGPGGSPSCSPNSTGASSAACPRRPCSAPWATACATPWAGATWAAMTCGARTTRSWTPCARAWTATPSWIACGGACGAGCR